MRPLESGELIPRWLQQSPLRQHIGPRGRAKQGFATELEARARSAYLNAKPDASKRRLYGPYECAVCHHWHIGRRKP